MRLKVLPKYFDEATLLALDPLIELAPDDPDGAKKDDDFKGAAELVASLRRPRRSNVPTSFALPCPAGGAYFKRVLFVFCFETLFD